MCVPLADDDDGDDDGGGKGAERAGAEPRGHAAPCTCHAHAIYTPGTRQAHDLQLLRLPIRLHTYEHGA